MVDDDSAASQTLVGAVIPIRLVVMAMNLFVVVLVLAFHDCHIPLLLPPIVRRGYP